MGRVENQAKRIKIVEGSTTAAAAPRVYHRPKNTQNHWSFSDKKFLAFLSRYWTEFRKLKILGMGGEVITVIIQKHNKIEARDFLQLDEKWSFCDFYNRILFCLPPMLLVGVALALSHSQTDAQFKRELGFRKTSTKIPVQKYPIRKYGTKTIYVKYTFTNSPYVIQSWMKFISRSHSVCGPGLEILDEVQKFNPLVMWP